jgi:DNA mismatch repair protein MutL
MDLYKEEDNIIKNEKLKDLKLYPVGQVHGTFIIAENEDGMYIIDQHAAHERVNYEMITKKFQEEEITYTDLLVPINIELSPSDYITFNNNKHVLEDLGFKFQEFGINTIQIKSHPSWLVLNYEGDNLNYVIDLLLEVGNNFNKEKFLDSLAKMTSCKMSVKANEHLSMEEMEHLLDDLVKCDNPYNCCHGRPSIIFYSRQELDKMFKRSGF